jgi:hypothetical protein
MAAQASRIKPNDLSNPPSLAEQRYSNNRRTRRVISIRLTHKSSMRRPVRVKAFVAFSFPASFLFEPSRLCRPLFPLCSREGGPGLSRSHLNSAVELDCSVTNSKRLPAPLSDPCAGFIHLSVHLQPMKQYRDLASALSLHAVRCSDFCGDCLTFLGRGIDAHSRAIRPSRFLIRAKT